MAKGAHEIPEKFKRVRGTQEIPRKRGFTARALILLLLLLALSVGGVTAFLSTSDGPLTNSFKVEENPGMGVNPPENENPVYNNDITVNTISYDYSGYAVFLRAAVVVNWEKDGDILAEMPVEGTDYELTLNQTTSEGIGWTKLSDGFYYYQAVISERAQYPAPVTITRKGNEGELKVTVLAQTVQAVGTTDVGDEPAVYDAWGVMPSDFLYAQDNS